MGERIEGGPFRGPPTEEIANLAVAITYDIFGKRCERLGLTPDAPTAGIILVGMRIEEVELVVEELKDVDTPDARELRADLEQHIFGMREVIEGKFHV